MLIAVPSQEASCLRLCQPARYQRPERSCSLNMCICFLVLTSLSASLAAACVIWRIIQNRVQDYPGQYGHHGVYDGIDMAAIGLGREVI